MKLNLKDLKNEEVRDIFFHVILDVTDRACAPGNSTPNDMGMVAFVDWIRDLYPELYTLNPNRENKS